MLSPSFQCAESGVESKNPIISDTRYNSQSTTRPVGVDQSGPLGALEGCCLSTYLGECVCGLRKHLDNCVATAVHHKNHNNKKKNTVSF